MRALGKTPPLIDSLNALEHKTIHSHAIVGLQKLWQTKPVQSSLSRHVISLFISLRCFALLPIAHPDTRKELAIMGMAHRGSRLTPFLRYSKTEQNENRTQYSIELQSTTSSSSES